MPKDEKARFSKVPSHQVQDFPLNFKDCQNLQALRRRLEHISNSLDSLLKPIECLPEHYKCFTTQEVSIEFRHLQQRVRRYMRRIHDLLRKLDSASFLVRICPSAIKRSKSWPGFVAISSYLKSSVFVMINKYINWPRQLTAILISWNISLFKANFKARTWLK